MMKNRKETIDLYRRLISKTEDYIEKNLDKKILLEDVADHVGMSAFHFHRIFKEFSDETLNEFVLRFKLDRSAIYLVMNQKISITEISLRYGFSESSAYSRAFKRHFMVTPTKFRKEQKLKIPDM